MLGETLRYVELSAILSLGVATRFFPSLTIPLFILFVALLQIGTLNYMSPESVIRSEAGQQMAVSLISSIHFSPLSFLVVVVVLLPPSR